MDSSAVNANITVDDFDSLLTYAAQSEWTSPDPSRRDFNAANSPWLRGTFHRTEVKDAELSLNFTGPAIYLYGHAGPQYGGYEVTVDGVATRLSAFNNANASTPHVLYSANNLTYAPHTLTLKNLGALDEGSGNALLFDFLRFTVQLAPAGATVRNVTLEEDNPAITYDGEWNNNTSPNFSGGGTAYTQADKASFSLSFNGSAIYVLGDKKNDHGLYNVYLDDDEPLTFTGVSGCGGAFGLTCEQQQPSIKFFASNLDEGEHTLRLENIAGVNRSFFDLDSIVITVPSEYGPRNLTAGGSTTEPGGNGRPTQPGNPSATPNNNAAMAQIPSLNMLLLLTMVVTWAVGGKALKFRL